MGGLYTAKKKTKSVGLTTIGAAVINIVIDLALIKTIGLYAASISTLISYIALTVFRMINVRKFIDIKYDMKNLLIILLLTTVSCGLLYFNSIYVYIFNILLSFVCAWLLNKVVIKKVVANILKKISRKK